MIIISTPRTENPSVLSCIHSKETVNKNVYNKTQGISDKIKTRKPLRKTHTDDRKLDRGQKNQG